ncbi:MAG: hypothetical protein ACO1O6_01650 [Bacteroidota bacterium]
MKNKLINKIDDTILDAAANGDMGFIDSFLEAEGFDLGQISVKAEKAFKQQSFYIKGIINRDKDKTLLEKVTTLFSDAIQNNLDKPVSYLRALIEQNKLGVQYRNLDKLEVEDIKTIIKDQNLLELLEKLENEE